MSRGARAADGALMWAIVGTVALVLGLALTLTSASTARAAQTIDVAVSFSGLMPGVTQSRGGAYTLARDARLASVEWTERNGILKAADLGVEICDSSGSCTDARTVVGTEFAAGELEIRLSVTLPATIGADGGQGSATGRLVFVVDEDEPRVDEDEPATREDEPATREDELALTGADTGVALLWGIALTISGAYLVCRARSRGPGGSVPGRPAAPTRED